MRTTAGSWVPDPVGTVRGALEFARPAVFLLSPASSYVTGTVLTVDGGVSRVL